MDCEGTNSSRVTIAGGQAVSRKNSPSSDTRRQNQIFNKWKLTEIAKGACRATSGSVAILDTGHLQKLLGHGGGDNTGTPGGGNEPHPDGAALAGHLAGHSVGLTDLVTPESTTDGHDRKLGQDDGTADGGGHLLGALDAQTHVAVVVADSHESLEAGTLTGAGLLLDGHDLQDLVLEGGAQEKVDDLKLLQGKDYY